MKLREHGLGLAWVLGVVMALQGCERVEPRVQPQDLDPPVNVVLFVVDALRQDHLGFDGYERDTSPSLDRLAAESFLFTQAFSQAPMTRIAMPSLLTSLYPSVHRTSATLGPLHEGFTTLAEILQQNGYATRCHTASPHQKLGDSIHHLHQGFDAVRAGDTVDVAEPGRRIVSDALEWVCAERREPFMVYLHLMDVHSPWVLPSSYAGMICNDSGLSKAEASRCRYDRMIRYVDDQIALLMGRLAETGLLDDTVVVITADHGQELFEHGRFGHSRTLYDEVIHVPLIFRLPSRFGAPGSSGQIVRHIDVLPTVLDILGIENPVPVQGVSLMPIIRDGAKLDLAAHAESLNREGTRAKPGPWAYRAAIRTDRWKLIRRVPYNAETGGLWGAEDQAEYELYDLEADSLESTNLAPVEPQVVVDLSQEMASWKQACRDLRSMYESLGVGETGAPELDEETLRRLRAFGYTE